MNAQSSSDHNPTVAFCQNCGKPLTAEERRVVAQAVFCEPCLAERLAAAPPPAAGGAYRYAASVPAYAPPPPIGPAPSPILAALLGFIPGVGAMYNGQYAKGLVHLVGFAVLVSLSGQSGFFGIFVPGWVFYQVIEAYQTAQARRDGTPLPNPLGLNDLGERLGFGRSWPTAASPGTPPMSAGVPPVTPPPVAETPVTETPRAAYDRQGPPWGQAASPTGGYAPGEPVSAPPYGARPEAGGAPRGVPYAPVPPVYEPPVAPPDRFPTGALWLIGLGVLFLIGNAGIFHHFPVYRLFPWLLIGFGVWLFVHKMLGTGVGLTDDGTPGYRRRIFGALRGSVWIVLTGVLFLLDMTHILSWSRSWPLWIIAAGVMTFLQRTVPPAEFAQIPGRPPYPYGPPQATAPSAAPAAPEGPGTGTAIVRHDEEGRQI